MSTNIRTRVSRRAEPALGRAGGESRPKEIWPSPGAWRKRQEALVDLNHRRLGVGPERNPRNGMLVSQVLDALGASSFAGFPAVRFPGTVVWCNFDLARQLGFDVPRSSHLTVELHDQLVASLSLRSVSPGDDIADQEVVTVYADKYGGDGVNPALGAGRAGFLPDGNLYVKGLGFTPLFKHNDKDDFVHSHGGVHLEDCLSEAVFGEVNDNLFTLGSTRIVAIIDQGMHVTEPSGRRRHIALAVRAGPQLRPGHLLARRARGGRSPLEMFIVMTRATDQLQRRADNSSKEKIPDISATMLRVIDDHARTAADSFRWRMIHGALSPSNMDLGGAMLDLPTQSTQPRTAPIFKLDYAQSAFGSEHKERGFYLADMYRRLLRATDPSTRERFNMKWLNVSNEMDLAYRKYLQVKLLGAAGLKTEVAHRLQAQHADLATRFMNVVLAMTTLRNPGSACTARRVVEDVSVLDVFHLLGKLPRDYFGNPNGHHKRNVLKHLKPVYKGNRFHIASKRAKVDLLAEEFANLYRELMNGCAALAGEYYDRLSAMEASIAARAAFENEPLDSLYCHTLYQELNQAIADYKSTGKAQLIREAVDLRIARSLRSVDGLLAQGNSRRLPGGGVELEMRTIGGVSYSVKAWNDDLQSRRLHVGIPVELQGKHLAHAVPGLGRLTKQQIQTLRYRFTTDRWRSSQEVGARLKYKKGLGFVIDFDDLITANLVGRLEGFFYTPAASSRTRRFSGYAFALPDRHDLLRMVTAE